MFSFTVSTEYVVARITQPRILPAAAAASPRLHGAEGALRTQKPAGLFQHSRPPLTSPEIHPDTQTEINPLACRHASLLLILSPLRHLLLPLILFPKPILPGIQLHHMRVNPV